MNKRGFTLVELLVVIAILGVLVGVAYIAINPAEMMKKSRDSKRLSDLATIRKAVDLALANGRTLTASTCTATVPCSSTGTRGVDGTGWVNVILSDYLSTLPIDPKAADSSFTDAAGASVTPEYQFANDGSTYELRGHLESTANASFYTTDGGDDAGLYEVGTKLSLL